MILFMNCSSVEEPDILKSGETSTDSMDLSSSSSLPEGQVLCYAAQHNICSVMPEKSCSVLEGLPVATCPGDAPSAGVSSSSGNDSPSSSPSTSPSVTSQIPFWRIYTDQEDANATIKGNSTVQNARNADGKYTVFLPDNGETVAKLQNYVLGRKLETNTGGIYGPFAGLSMTMVDNVEYYNLFTCQNGFAYEYKGAAHKFQVLISAVSDYNFHAKNIIYSSSSWETVTVLFSDLKQASWGTKVSFDIRQTLDIEWQVRGDEDIATETGNLAVKNLRCAN